MSNAFVIVRSEQAPGAELPGQLGALTALIEREPDVPVHYLVRGEEWLLYGDVDRARDDFLTAQRLAAELASTRNWGYLAQAYVDRCEVGLRRCSVNLEP